jgi:hypothetical protein
MKPHYVVYLRGDANGVISPLHGPKGGWTSTRKARSAAQVDAILFSTHGPGILGRWYTPRGAKDHGLVLPHGDLLDRLVCVAATADRGLTYICIHNPSTSQED